MLLLSKCLLSLSSEVHPLLFDGLTIVGLKGNEATLRLLLCRPPLYSDLVRMQIVFDMIRTPYKRKVHIITSKAQ